MSDGAVYRDDWLARVLYRRVKYLFEEELMKIQCGIYGSVGRSCTDTTLTVHQLVKNPGSIDNAVYDLLTSRHHMTLCQSIFHMNGIIEEAWVIRCSSLSAGTTHFLEYASEILPGWSV